jgi:hypothetical protein
MPTQSRAYPCFPPQIDQKLKKDSYNMSFSWLSFYIPMCAYELQDQEKGDKSTETETEKGIQHTFALSSADMPRASSWYNCPDFTLIPQAVQ